MTRLPHLLMTLCLTTAATSCATSKERSSGAVLGPAGAGASSSGCPRWVDLGSRACASEKSDQKRVCDVGLSPKMDDPELRRSSSESSGKEKIASRLKTHITSITKNWADRPASGTMGTTERRDVLARLNQTDLDLSGVAAVDHCVATDGREFSLMEMSFDGIKDAINSMNQLPKELKEEIIQKSNAVFDELNQIHNSNK